MEQQDNQLSVYRQSLIESLSEQPARRFEEEPASLQVFVNHHSVSTLDCRDRKGSFRYIQDARPITLVELRSANGLLIGAFSPAETGMCTKTFSCGDYRFDVHVDNRPEGGSFQVSYEGVSFADQRLWNRIRSTMGSFCRLGKPITETASQAEPRFVLPGYWKAVAIGQALVALAAVFLLAERIIDPVQPSVSSETIQSSSPEVSEQQRMPALLSQMQRDLAEVLSSQQQEMTRLAQTLQAVSRAQERLNSHLAAVERRVGDSTNAVLASLQRVVADRDSLQEQVHQLTEAKQALTAAVVKLQQRDVQAVKSQPDTSSLSRDPKEPKAAAEPAAQSSAVQPTIPPQVAQAQPGPSESPLRFWVSFQEGTSEESINRLIQEIHGRRGPTNAGWHSVEVNLPQSQKVDEFLQSLQEKKPVKALTTSLKLSSEQER